MGVIHRQRIADGRLRWEGVALETYEGPRASAVTKQVLIGPEEGAAQFAVRYFEIAPGGTSAFDQHLHDHGVVVLTGDGRVRLGSAWHPIRAGDAVYVAPDEVHQFENTGATPLGFLCVVGARRSA